MIEFYLNLIWFDMICFDLIRFDSILIDLLIWVWFDLIWFRLIWFDLYILIILLCCILYHLLFLANIAKTRSLTFVVIFQEKNKAASNEFNSRVVECRLAAKILAKRLIPVFLKRFSRFDTKERGVGNSASVIPLITYKGISFIFFLLKLKNTKSCGFAFSLLNLFYLKWNQYFHV